MLSSGPGVKHKLIYKVSKYLMIVSVHIIGKKTEAQTEAQTDEQIGLCS